MEGISGKVFVGFTAGALAVVFAPAVSPAASITQLHFDVNSITIQAVNQAGANAFGGLTHSGFLMFGIDTDSYINGIGLDGLRQTSYNGSLVGFSGKIDFLNGVSQSGNMTLTVLNPDLTLDQYSFQIANQVKLRRPDGESSFRSFGYQLDADTFNGLFVDGNNDGKFGGVDIALFKAQQPLEGAFFQLKYVPNDAGFSNQSDVDIITSAVVPTPEAALSGLGLIGLLGAVQWYRSSRRNSSDE